jgi:predicted HAD superfamily Cof-like phosphohydrolase
MPETTSRTAREPVTLWECLGASCDGFQSESGCSWDASPDAPAICIYCGGEAREVRMLFADDVEAERSFAARALAEFHEHPNALPETTNTQALRRTLHEEEHDEMIEALIIAEHAGASTPEAQRIALGMVARELADVVYVAYGTAWAFGIDLDAALAEIHRCAMVKMDAGLRREDGKILKPPGFVPPDMTAAIANAELRADGGRDA